jgi:hypothetical protein
MLNSRTGFLPVLVTYQYLERTGKSRSPRVVVVATGHTRDLDFGVSSITPGLMVEHPASRYRLRF